MRTKTTNLYLRVSTEEKIMIQAAAGAAGLSVSDWARSVLLDTTQPTFSATTTFPEMETQPIPPLPPQPPSSEVSKTQERLKAIPKREPKPQAKKSTACPRHARMGYDECKCPKE